MGKKKILIWRMNESNWFRVCMVYMFCSAKLLRFYQCMQAREVIWCCIQSLWLKRVAKSLALASQLSASSVGFQSHQCCLSFLYSYSQIKALTIENYEVLCGCFEKDRRHGQHQITNVLRAVKLCNPSVRDSKEQHLIIVKIHRELKHLLPTPLSLWGRVNCCFTFKCLKVIIFTISWQFFKWETLFQ